MTWSESYSFTLVIKSDTKHNHLKIGEFNGTWQTKVTVGKNDINLENYPNAVYFYSQKSGSNYNFMPMIWVASDTSTIQITIDAEYNVKFDSESLYQIELNKIVSSSRNIHLGPFPYEPQGDKPLEPILAMEAKAITQNLEVSTDRRVLMNLLDRSEEREIKNWSTDVISTYLKHRIYDHTTNKLIKIIGLDSFENQIEINPDGKKNLLLAISASWCGPCIKSLPKMRKTYDEISDNIIFVSTWKDPNLKTFTDNHRNKKQVISWPNLWDPYGLMPNAIRIKTFPSYILFDPSGKEINRWEGKFPNNLESIISK